MGQSCERAQRPPAPNAGKEHAWGLQRGEPAVWGLVVCPLTGGRTRVGFALGRSNRKSSLTEHQRAPGGKGWARCPPCPAGHPLLGQRQGSCPALRVFFNCVGLLFHTLPQKGQRDGSDPAPAPETGGAGGKRMRLSPYRFFFPTGCWHGAPWESGSGGRGGAEGGSSGREGAGEPRSPQHLLVPVSPSPGHSAASRAAAFETGVLSSIRGPLATEESKPAPWWPWDGEG